MVYALARGRRHLSPVTRVLDPKDGIDMNTINRGLTTVVMTIATAVVAIVSAQSRAQNAAPNAGYHRFQTSPMALDPESGATSAAATGDAATLATEPRSSGPFREAPAAFDNR